MAQIIFVALPTIAVVYFLLQNVNNFYNILSKQQVSQTIYFGSSLILSIIFYAYRFKFLPTFAVLLFVFFSIYKMLGNIAIGEFDAFAISVNFLVFAILFSVAWLCGWAFQRIAYFHIIISCVLLLCSLYVIARGNVTQYATFLGLLAPIVLYTAYIIFTAENIRNVNTYNKIFWIKLLKRLFAFSTIALCVFLIIATALRQDIEAKISESQGKGKNGGNAVSQKDADGNTQMNDGMKMAANNKRDNELIFIAHIDNTFEGTDLPNPLYLTAYHYTKFDNTTETFERDPNMLSNDEFLPKPGTLPLYQIVQDSSKLKNALATKMRKEVSVEVYSAKMHKNMFVAPSTSYKIQPIAIDQNFKKDYNRAYRTTSSVSKLNSAYFIYNTNDPVIQSFQEMRFALLRKAQNYNNIDSAFYKYYTNAPTSNGYMAIKNLADSIAKGKTTTIDKVIAVRDYFTQRTKNGEAVYKYTDNPGIPGLPSASKLLYFLLQTRKGYCAYYAGATLMLLRNMGVPCRIAVGYLTVDRSDKNKGWYWYYGDQAHAWVEVYFPEYGWIDFDTTVGNTDAQESNQADGTPPSIPQKAPLVLSGTVTNVDTTKKEINLKLDAVVLNEKSLEAINLPILLDVEFAKILKDTLQLPLAKLVKGEHIMAISYNKKLAQMQANSSAQLVSKLSNPFAVDDIIVQDIQQETKQKDVSQKEQTHLSTKQVLWRLLLFILGLIILLFLIPTLVLRYYKLRAKFCKTNAHKAFYNYKYINLYAHLLGQKRLQQTPLQFAQSIDAKYKTNATIFTNIYLKTKYSKAKLLANEDSIIQNALPQFTKTVRQNTTFAQRFKAQFATITLINFFINNK